MYIWTSSVGAMSLPENTLKLVSVPEVPAESPDTWPIRVIHNFKSEMLNSHGPLFWTIPFERIWELSVFNVTPGPRHRDVDPISVFHSMPPFAGILSFLQKFAHVSLPRHRITLLSCALMSILIPSICAKALMEHIVHHFFTYSHAYESLHIAILF